MYFFKRHLKKLVALTLAMTMAIGLAACGSTEDPEPTATPGTGTQTPTQTQAPSTSGTETPTETSEPYVRPAKDLGGKEVVWFAWYNWISGWDVEPEAESENYDQAMQRYTHRMGLFDRWNVTFRMEVVPSAQILAILTTSVMAGGGDYDICRVQGSQIMSMIYGGLIVSPTDFIPADADVWNAKNWSQPHYQYAKIGEEMKTWSIMNIESDGEGYILGVNMDIINAIGAEDPGELYDNGQWTWDKFLEIARRATGDPLNEGYTTRYGIAGWPSYITELAIASNDGVMVRKDGNRYVPAMDDPKTMRALEFCATLFDANYPLWYPPKDAGTSFNDYNWGTQAKNDGVTAFFADNFSWGAGGEATEALFNYSSVPFPKGPDNNTTFVMFNNFGGNVVFPVGPGGMEMKTNMYYVFEDYFGWYGENTEWIYDPMLDDWMAQSMTIRDAERLYEVYEQVPNPTKKIEPGLLIAGYKDAVAEIFTTVYSEGSSLSSALAASVPELQNILDAQINSRVR